MDCGVLTQSFPKSVRIIKSKDFLEVIRARGSGLVRFHGKWFEVKAKLIDEEPKFQVGLTVGKRFAKRSVDRNLIKRILREEIRCSSLSLSVENEHSAFSVRVVFRLKAPLPSTLFRTPYRDSLKQEMREDCRILLEQLVEKLVSLRMEKTGD